MKHIFIFLILIMSSMLLLAETPYQTVSGAGVTFHYRVSDDSMYLDGIMVANTTGWVAVGFNPTNQMANADIIIGYHENDMTMIRDDWGTSATSHASDESLGGTSNVMNYSSFEEEGNTEIHFMIPLNSGDDKDHIMEIGMTYPIILARGQNGADNFGAYHAAAGFSSINLVEPTSSNEVIQPVIAPLALNNYPNPFNPTTTFKVAVNEELNASLTVYDIRGKKIKNFGEFALGNHEVIWDGRDNSNNPVSSGIYFSVLKGKNTKLTRKINLIK